MVSAVDLRREQELVNYVQDCCVYKYYNYNNEQVYHCRNEFVKFIGKYSCMELCKL